MTRQESQCLPYARFSIMILQAKVYGLIQEGSLYLSLYCFFPAFTGYTLSIDPRRLYSMRRRLDGSVLYLIENVSLMIF